MHATVNRRADLTGHRDLAVAWMNRGNELMVHGDPPNLAGSLQAYDEAIGLLRALMPGANPSWANSLGAALMNRGHLLHRLHVTAQAALALAAFDEAAIVLRSLPETDNPWPRRNLAGVLLNTANLRLDLNCLDEAASSAREGLNLVMPAERSHEVDAELALKARRVLCDAIGRIVVAPDVDYESLAREASDLVDDAMAVTRDWAGRGNTSFVFLAQRFFRFGVQLYRFHQPQFLAEFVRENLASDPEFRAIALEAVNAALADRPSGFLVVGDPASERRLETWRDLASLRADLVA